MKACAREAGKLARYEHIGWNEWPQSRCWTFHSGGIAIAGSSAGSSRASWVAVAGAAFRWVGRASRGREAAGSGGGIGRSHSSSGSSGRAA
jgi:hypothetical protein